MKHLKILLSIGALLASMMTFAQSSDQDTVCINASGEKYFINKTAGSTYDWSITGGYTNLSVHADQDTIYVDWGATTGTDTIKIVETNSDGCEGDTVRLAVTRIGLPIANAGSDESIGNCSGQSAQLDASGSTGSGTLTYSWSPSASLSNANIVNPVATPSTTQTYTVTVTSSHGCSSTDDVTITVDPAVTADAGSDASIGSCSGQSTTLNGSGTGDNITYTWSPATGLSNPNIANPTANPATTTTYTLTVEDDNGCQETDDVTITVDPAVTVDAGSDATICNGGSTTLNGSGTGDNITYTWSPATGLSNPNIANPTASPTSTTTYTLTVEDDNGCQETSTVDISVNTPATANAGTDEDLCEGNDITLSATASNQTAINWTTSGDGTFTAGANSTTPTYNPGTNDISNGTVTLTIEATSATGCPAATDDIIITINPKPTTSPIYHF